MKQAPNVNGIMALTAAEAEGIKIELQSIHAAHVPTDEEPILSTHAMVSQYNQTHVGAEINGDTAEYVLSAGE